MHTCAVVSRKGGTGKTTTAANLGAALAARGRRVLLLDADPQANLTWHYGEDPEAGPTLADALLGRSRSLPPGAVRRVGERLDLVAGSPELVDVDTKGEDAARFLGEVLALLPSAWDLALLDTPPALAGLGVSALCAADSFLVTLLPDPFSLRGVPRLLAEVDALRANLGCRAQLLGVLLLRVGRTRLAEEAEADLRASLGRKVFRTVVPQTVKVAEAASWGKPLLAYAPSSGAAEAYRALAAEVESRLRRG